MHIADVYLLVLEKFLQIGSNFPSLDALWGMQGILEYGLSSAPIVEELAAEEPAVNNAATRTFYVKCLYEF